MDNSWPWGGRLCAACGSDGVPEGLALLFVGSCGQRRCLPSPAAPRPVGARPVPLGRRSYGRQPDRHVQAARRRRVQGRLAAAGVGEALHQGEAESRATLGSARGAPEAVEGAGPLLLRQGPRR
ncbi:cAMP and cAMP-inhibited cGMP 3',5'-cyclic phosphodiesterase 10A [Streptomyces azureus]|uniref:cAMP and cAMP-inhibited cGMP 3',5'-cyclic phosphodiesterase 10A n=1 Tax=Streptomyces azureus TaxID=146537 RepID=A0A0K8PYE1_STRAJ|nr:cAMP and cAMP-inhibited cGMP 3',5'-cyclic phosphodiesterase 10A [Streptomyces azureus]